MTTTNPPGLDLARLTAWLDARVPGGCGPLAGEILPGGRSNLTYVVADGRRSWVVRRPPIGEVLATAHDVAREHRVLAAFAGTPVPVPEVFGLGEPDVLGAPFYVMEHVAGTTYRNASDLAVVGAEKARRICEGLVDTLAALHAVDPASIGLDTLGRPEGFLGRQVRRWYLQFEAVESPALALAQSVHARLAARVPADAPPGIVHGDYRLDNVIVGHDDRPAAVIDWEMATCGDVLTDLALLVVYQRTAQLAGTDVVPTASSAAGYLDEQELVERYAAASDRDLDRFGFHLALASFKLAGIIAGIHHRHVSGQVHGPGVDRVGALVEPLLESARSALEENT